MRKDLVLGMSIGGVLLLLVIIYLAVAPSNTKRGPAANVGTGGGQQVAETPVEGESPTPAESPHGAGGRSALADASHVTPPPAPAHSTDTSWEHEVYRGSVPPSLHAEGRMSTMPPTTYPADHPTYEAAASAHTGAPVTGVSPAPAGAAAAARTHEVRAGETPSSIAAMAYGNPNFYPYILRANPGLDANHLKIGTIINLPDVASVRAAQPATLPSAARVAPASVDPKTHYLVESGDSLYKISIKLYGSAAMVQAIYDANKEEIGPDQRALKLHQVLKLPKSPTVAPTTQE